MRTSLSPKRGIRGSTLRGPALRLGHPRGGFRHARGPDTTGRGPPVVHRRRCRRGAVRQRPQRGQAVGRTASLERANQRPAGRNRGPAPARGGAAAGPEARGHRAPGGRRGPRLQQHPDGDPGVHRHAPGRSAGDTGTTRSDLREIQRRRAPRQRSHAAAAGVRAQAGAHHPSARPQRRPRRHEPHAGAADWRKRPAGAALRHRGLPHRGRSGAARTGAHQPRGQRARRDVGPRHAVRGPGSRQLGERHRRRARG